MVRHLGRCIVIVSTLLAFSLAAAAHASFLIGQVTLRADSLRVPADPNSTITITIEVLDAAGKPVADGTSVNLITTLGQIVSPVQTIGGLAQTVLTPSSAAGTALVSAMVGSARATLEIEFTAGPGSSSPGSRMVELSAEELSYSPDWKMFVGGPNARLVHEAVEIRSEGMEYDVMANVVYAQGTVIIKSGSAELRADALRYDLSSLRGSLLRIEQPLPTATPTGAATADEPTSRATGDDPNPVASSAVRLLVEGEKLTTRADPSKEGPLRPTTPPNEVRTWIKARTAIVHPREKVVLDHAAVYVDDLRVMGMRRHVMDPRRGSSLFGNTFGYSSLLGAAMDIPYYYRASGSQVGSLHFTHSRSVGGIGGGPGWGLGLKEEWIREGHSEGSLSVEDLTHPTRDISLRQQVKLGAGSALSMDAGVSSFQNGMPTLKAAGVTYYRPVSAGRLSLTLSGSDFGTSEYYFGALAYRLKTKALGSGVLVTPVVSLRQSLRHSTTSQVLVDPETGETIEISKEDSGRTTSPGFDLDVSLPSRTISPKLQLTGALHTGYAWGLSGGSRAIFDWRFGLVRQLPAGGLIRLDYNYSGAPASLQSTPFSIARQRVSLNGRARMHAYDLRFNISQEIGGDRLFGNFTAVRPLPWGNGPDGPLWQLAASHVFSHVAQFSLASSRLALSRRFGQYRLAVCYSPQGKGGFESQPWVSLDGYGYTYSGGRHLWIEVNSAGF